MSQFYKILTADPLGEPYTPSFAGAKPTQTYWCQFEGVDKAVSMGKQVGNVPIPGSHVYGDLLYAKSQKGNEYWKFKSAKVPDGVQRPADSPAQSTAQVAIGEVVGTGIPAWFQPFGNTIIENNKILKQLRGDEPEVEPPQKVEQVGGEPLDEDTKQMLDNIFTPDEEV